MILKQLQMRDFRCYAGIVSVEFAADPKRNTTIIQGTNGAGKTSILHALNFALYGKPAVPNEPDAPIINNAMLKGAREDSPARARVVLDFVDGGRRYRLSRTIYGFLVSGRTHYMQQKADDLRLTFTKLDGNTERDPLPQQTIERMLPSPIRTFFLFDGDRIADFTRPGRERDEKINKAVNDVLHIEALSRAASRTAKITGDKNKALERAGAPSVEKLAMDISLQDMEIERRRNLVAEMHQEIERLTDRSSAIDAELIAIAEVAKLAQERRTLEGRHDTMMERRSQLQQQLLRASIDSIPALLNKEIVKSNDILAKYKSRHEIPARIADYFLKDLLDRATCICGRSLDPDTPEREELEGLLRSLLPDTIQDKATELSSRLRPLKDEADARITAVVRFSKAIQENAAEISRLDKEIDRIGGDIDATALDRSVMLNRERAAITQRLMELKSKIGLAERNVEVALNTKKSLVKSQESELAKQVGLRGLNQEWVVARECADAFARAKSILEERLRVTLGTEATEILRNLASTDKKYFFSEVKVDPNFLLRVIDHSGGDVRAQLSMGETQVSSLAFMLAMTRLGGQEAPLVVDTPLARLDRSVRANAARWLPNLTSQLVLLVTDAEYDPDVEEQIAPSVGKRMRLVPASEGTRVDVIAYA